MATMFDPGREQVRVTATPNMQTERAAAFDPNGGSGVDQLLKALGSDSTQQAISEFNAAHERKKLEAQQGKFDWYVEQFAKDHAGGAVSQAQVKGRFPETVPVIASRIAEAIGQQDGRKRWQSVIDEIAQDDSLRLDTAKRSQFLAAKRAEITADVGTDNEFYGSGLVSSMDKLTRQYEATWQSETAAYHQKVQTEQFSGEVVDGLNSSDPKGALLALDEKWAKSSSLNPLERNKAVVASAIDLAFVNDDHKVLDAVPPRFLNVDSKAAIERAKVQLTDRRFTEFRRAQELQTIQRSENLRKSKVSILADVAAGKDINPAAYRSDPEAFQFALTMREVPRVDESTSVGNAQSIRNYILTSASMGDGETVQELTDKIVGNPKLNPKERQALIAELPKLVEGRQLMGDDMVRQPISDRLAPRLQALETSTNSVIQSLLTGRNLRSEVMKGYEGDIRNSFLAEYEETGVWPKGRRKLELIDAAVERAEKRLEDATKIGGKAEASTPKPATALPKGVTKLN